MRNRIEREEQRDSDIRDRRGYEREDIREMRREENRYKQ